MADPELRILNTIRCSNFTSGIRIVGREELILSATDSGPSPGMIEVTTSTAQVDFSELTVPGWCWIFNYGPADVNWGYYFSPFHSVGLIKVNESASFRLRSAIGTNFGVNTDSGVAKLVILAWES